MGPWKIPGHHGQQNHITYEVQVVLYCGPFPAPHDRDIHRERLLPRMKIVDFRKIFQGRGGIKVRCPGREFEQVRGVKEIHANRFPTMDSLDQITRDRYPICDQHIRGGWEEGKTSASHWSVCQISRGLQCEELRRMGRDDRSLSRVVVG